MYNPFAFYRVTQGFSSLHQAIDYAMGIGTVLPACSSGRVVYGFYSDAGYTATITRPDGSSTRYCHGSAHGFPAPHDIAERTPVKMLSGNSGTSTGPHLHVYDTAVDGSRRPPFTTGTTTAGGDIRPIEEEEDMSTDYKMVHLTTVIQPTDQWAHLNGMRCLLGPLFFSHFGSEAEYNQYANRNRLISQEINLEQFMQEVAVNQIPVTEVRPGNKWHG